MNSIRINGDVIAKPRVTTNKKKGCPQIDFLLSCEFSHPHAHFDENYRAYLRTYVIGEPAEQLIGEIEEGDFVEIKHGFLHTWFNAATAHYQIIGIDVDIERCGEKPADYKPWNISRFSGFVVTQFATDQTDEGIKKIGVSIAALPDIVTSDEYRTYTSIWLYGEDAERADGKLKRGQKIDFVEGPMQSFRNRKGYGLYTHVTRIDF